MELACSDDPGEAGQSLVESLRQQGFEVQVLRTEVMPKFIGKIFTFLNDSHHRDIGTPESLQTAEREYSWHPAA